MIEALRPGGSCGAPWRLRIQAILEAITPEGGEPDLDWLAGAPRDEALDYLVSLPGVGRKTAACVMLFALGRPEIPVDVHVYRVGGRLGLFPPKAKFETAHDEMLAITDPADAYELHMNLIRHGREVCRLEAPACDECGPAAACAFTGASLRRSSGP